MKTSATLFVGLLLLMCGCGYNSKNKLEDELAHYKTEDPKMKEQVAAVRAALPSSIHYITVVPQVEILEGAVIKESDISSRRGEVFATEDEHFATDPEQVIGHTALKPLHAGTDVRLTEISK